MEFVGCDSHVTMIDRSGGKRGRKAGQGTNHDVESSAEEEGRREKGWGGIVSLGRKEADERFVDYV